MGNGATFRNELLDDMVAVGRAEARAVRLWMRSSRPGRLAVSWWEERAGARVHVANVEVVAGVRDQTACVTLPPDAVYGLEPLTRYRYRVTHTGSGHVLGEGSFETAPGDATDTPARFAFAVMSCHQPFDPSGRIRVDARQMLRAAYRCLQDHHVRYVLMLGDQIYADYPERASLFDAGHFATVAPPGRRSILECTTDEVRALYHQRYRRFWNVPELKAIQADFPCYMILDDHDVLDNWGTNPAHGHPPWKTVGEGALDACFDYQTSRVLASCDRRPEAFDYAFTYGHTSTFVMDLRSERRGGADGRLVSARQLERLEAFLHASSSCEVVFLALSVPMVHVPRRLARAGSRLPSWGEDFSDRWSSEAHVRDRDRVLSMLYAHQCRYPLQRLVLLSGDIHIGCAHRIRWQGSGLSLYQLVASPLTHATPRWVQLASKQLIRFKHRLATRDGQIRGQTELLPGVAGYTRNLYGGLNVGIVEVETPPSGAAPTLQFSLYGHRDDAPVCVYRSPSV